MVYNLNDPLYLEPGKHNIDTTIKGNTIQNGPENLPIGKYTIEIINHCGIKVQELVFFEVSDTPVKKIYRRVFFENKFYLWRDMSPVENDYKAYAENRFVNITGDTMTGDLHVSNGAKIWGAVWQ